MQGLAKKPAAGSGDALGARASGAHPAGCLQSEKERQKRGRPAMTTTPLRQPFAPHSPDPLLAHGEKEEFGRPETQNERRNAGASQKTCPCKASILSVRASDCTISGSASDPLAAARAAREPSVPPGRERERPARKGRLGVWASRPQRRAGSAGSAPASGSKALSRLRSAEHAAEPRLLPHYLLLCWHVGQTGVEGLLKRIAVQSARYSEKNHLRAGRRVAPRFSN
jgi:hypothetical protein